jgi:ABC-type sugar transport system substrate-binding protein
MNSRTGIALTCIIALFAMGYIHTQPVNAASEQPLIYHLSIKEPSDPFGKKVEGFMSAVAQDLGVNLKVIHLNSTSSMTRRRETEQLLKGMNDYPDLIVSYYDYGILTPLLQFCSLQKIPCITFNRAPHAKELKQFGLPRTKFSYFIGHLSPDDTNAGHTLADILITQALKLANTPQNGQIDVVALEGGSDFGNVSVARLNGLKRRLQNESRVTLQETLASDWTKNGGYASTQQLFKNHPGAFVYWTAADVLSLGVLDELTGRGLKPGVDFITGGFDWTDEGMSAIRQGKMVASLGGHFMEGGTALLLGFDYLHGSDFANELGTSILTPMYAVTKNNVERYLQKFGDGWDSVDFTQYSKTLNPQRRQYELLIKPLVQFLD